MREVGSGSDYAHRVVISNRCLLAFEQERVIFRWENYARGGKPSRMSLATTEFLRRFFLHVLPQRLRPFRSPRVAFFKVGLIDGSQPKRRGVQADLHTSTYPFFPDCRKSAPAARFLRWAGVTPRPRLGSRPLPVQKPGGSGSERRGALGQADRHRRSKPNKTAD